MALSLEDKISLVDRLPDVKVNIIKQCSSTGAYKPPPVSAVFMLKSLFSKAGFAYKDKRKIPLIAHGEQLWVPRRQANSEILKREMEKDVNERASRVDPIERIDEEDGETIVEVPKRINIFAMHYYQETSPVKGLVDPLAASRAVDLTTFRIKGYIVNPEGRKCQMNIIPAQIKLVHLTLHGAAEAIFQINQHTYTQVQRNEGKIIREKYEHLIGVLKPEGIINKLIADSMDKRMWSKTGMNLSWVSAFYIGKPLSGPGLTVEITGSPTTSDHSERCASALNWVATYLIEGSNPLEDRSLLDAFHEITSTMTVNDATITPGDVKDDTLGEKIWLFVNGMFINNTIRSGRVRIQTISGGTSTTVVRTIRGKGDTSLILRHPQGSEAFAIEFVDLQMTALVERFGHSVRTIHLIISSTRLLEQIPQMVSEILVFCGDVPSIVPVNLRNKKDLISYINDNPRSSAFFTNPDIGPPERGKGIMISPIGKITYSNTHTINGSIITIGNYDIDSSDKDSMITSSLGVQGFGPDGSTFLNTAMPERVLERPVGVDCSYSFSMLTEKRTINEYLSFFSQVIASNNIISLMKEYKNFIKGRATPSFISILRTATSFLEDPSELNPGSITAAQYNLQKHGVDPKVWFQCLPFAYRADNHHSDLFIREDVADDVESMRKRKKTTDSGLTTELSAMETGEQIRGEPSRVRTFESIFKKKPRQDLTLLREEEMIKTNKSVDLISKISREMNITFAREGAGAGYKAIEYKYKFLNVEWTVAAGRCDRKLKRLGETLIINQGGMSIELKYKGVFEGEIAVARCGGVGCVVPTVYMPQMIRSALNSAIDEQMRTAQEYDSLPSTEPMLARLEKMSVSGDFPESVESETPKERPVEKEEDYISVAASMNLEEEDMES